MTRGIDLLDLPFDGNFIDTTGRHILYNGNPGYNCGTVTFVEGRIGQAAYFDGNSFLINTTDTTHITKTGQEPECLALTLTQLPHADDFLLGATRHIMNWSTSNFVSVNSDNSFTIDCWVKLMTGGRRVYPICSSSSYGYYGGVYKIGWTLQIDTVTGHLQMIGCFGGDWLGSVLESQFSIPFNEWTHIAVSIWRTTNYPSPTCQMMWKNGTPDSYSAWTNNICRFSNGMFPINVLGWMGQQYNIGPSTYQYSPFFVGLGPTSVEPVSWTLNPYYGYYFKGCIDNLRICLGDRWPATNQIYVNRFTPPGIETTTTSTTVTTTTSTTASTTTYHSPAFVRDLLVIPFDNDVLRDSSGRHSLFNSGAHFSLSENNSYQFTSSSRISILVEDNRADWYLGSTPVTGYHPYHGAIGRRSLSDNNFCIDCWIKPLSGGDRYYPIFSVIGLPAVGALNCYSGCCLQLDTQTGHLQFCQYAYGGHINLLDNINNLIESTFVVPMNQWSHIAVQSWNITPVSLQSYIDRGDHYSLVPGLATVFSKRNIYLNGIPDTTNGLILDSVFAGVNVYDGLLLDLLVGEGKVFDFPKVDANKVNYYFNGYIKNFRISEGPRFPTDGSVFNSQVTTSTSTTTLSTTTLSTTSTTTLSTMSSTTVTTTLTTTTSTATTTVFIPRNEPDKAFDNNLVTKWVPSLTDTTPWVGMKFTKPYKITQLRLYFPYNQLFSQFHFQGSNDKSSWVMVLSEIIPTVEGWNTFSILLDSGYFIYYRLVANNWNGPSGITSFELYGYPESDFSTTFSTTSQTTLTTTQTSTTTSTLTSTTTSTITWTTGTTLTYTTTSTWTTTTESYTTTTPIPPYTRVSIDGSAQASNYIGEYVPENAFDQDINTFWLCSPYDDPPYWVSYGWSEDSYVVDEYKLYLTTGGRPKNWEFQGSNNGSDWDVLDEQYNVETEGLVDIVIDNTTAYSNYRLYITDVWSRLYGIRINEIQFYVNRNVNESEDTMHWLGYNFNESILVQRYCMMVPEGSDFSEWKLQGSNDGVFWTDVDYKIDPGWVGWRCVDVEENELSFSRWRLLIMNYSRLSNPKLVEFEVFRRP